MKILDRTKIIISNHALERFEERGIKFYKNENKIINQIKFDLNPLNIRLLEKLNEHEYKVITKQGKCYITRNVGEDKTLIKTVYKLNRKEVMKKEMI